MATTRPPEAELIHTRRIARLEKLTVQEAARRAEDLSGERFAESTWRLIERDGSRIPGKLALMARVVGNITPEDFDAIGRPDAGDALRLDQQQREAPPSVTDAVRAQIAEEFRSSMPDELWELAQAYSDIDQLDASPEQRAAMKAALREHLASGQRLHDSHLKMIKN
ncbi:hypothetical protein ACIBKY_51255 [Nonomuraea sp. NPDC050394]|uniref:hypothetical protein n=1 Tax=Nonomuraea sp. NPDC050394 TaxID=3364363 RepID=UPI0037A637C7